MVGTNESSSSRRLREKKSISSNWGRRDAYHSTSVSTLYIYILQIDYCMAVAMANESMNRSPILSSSSSSPSS